MKLKATVSDVLRDFSAQERYALARMVRALNDPELPKAVYDEVLVRHLRVPPRNTKNAWGPAEAFDQECDRMIPWHDYIGVDVTLSGVSVTARRAPADFWEATTTLQSLYAERIAQFLLDGMNAQLFVRMALDKPIDYLDRQGQTSLPEIGPIAVMGEAEQMPGLTPEVLLSAELIARLGTPTAMLLLETLRNSEAIKLPLGIPQ